MDEDDKEQREYEDRLQGHIQRHRAVEQFRAEAAKRSRSNGNGKDHLYGLADLAGDQLIVVVAGEAQVDFLRTWGVNATCCTGGFGKWEAAHSVFFKDADVVIVPPMRLISSILKMSEHHSPALPSASGFSCSPAYRRRAASLIGTAPESNSMR